MLYTYMYTTCYMLLGHVTFPSIVVAPSELIIAVQALRS